MDYNFVRFRCPFTCMISGPTGSGKTVLLRRILKHHKILLNVNVSSLKVIWCYGIWQNLYNESIDSTVTCEYINGICSQNDINQYQPHIIVIDDLMSQLSDDVKLVDLFTKGSHHLNFSVFFVTQNLFHKGKSIRDISLNCHYIILLKNPRDQNQIVHFARQAFPQSLKFFTEAYQDATNKEYGYLRVDFTQQTNDKYRLISRMTPEESESKNHILPVVYIPK